MNSKFMKKRIHIGRYWFKPLFVNVDTITDLKNFIKDSHSIVGIPITITELKKGKYKQVYTDRDGNQIQYYYIGITKHGRYYGQGIRCTD